jgi:hypothetical protein
MEYLGDFDASGNNTQVYCYFTTSAQTGAPIGPSSDFEVGDVRVYKDGNSAERNNTSGYAVYTNFDSVTGLHLLTLDLTSNAIAGFYANGHTYTIVLAPDTETVDGLAVVSILGQFTIGMTDTAALRVWQVANADLDPSATDSPYGAIMSAIADIGNGGPVEQAKVPLRRVLKVRDRGNGLFDTDGSVRMRARNGSGEKLYWALELKGTQLAIGDLAYGMEAPTTAGAQASNLSVTAYGVSGTKIIFFAELNSAALDTDDITIEFNVSPDPTEVLLISVPVEVKN